MIYAPIHYRDLKSGLRSVVEKTAASYGFPEGLRKTKEVGPSRFDRNGVYRYCHSIKENYALQYLISGDDKEQTTVFRQIVAWGDIDDPGDREKVGRGALAFARRYLSEVANDALRSMDGGGGDSGPSRGQGLR